MVGAAVESGSQISPTAQETAQTKSNTRRRLKAESTLAEILDLGMTPGFFGTLTLSITFHDGNVQHLTRRMEQLLKS